MKVKIDNKIYNSEEVPIMLIMSENEKAQMSNMPDDSLKYGAAPDRYWHPDPKMSEFMFNEWMKR